MDNLNVVDIRDYKLGKSLYRILKVWDERSQNPHLSPQHRMVAKKLAKTYREAIDDICCIVC